ncbi:hypothetical protein [Glycomyces paridis]|uniref:Uncharacterized protein n=1 Tax=Glycomyces paridis TaxID=2126555 RepID=A0A4S8P2T2_9ACTN|nr:hypothetical protein [Glycomyces paridis]THV23585.1 hypothetical protein E9998_22580 [Glycomyces paridis]
MRTAAVIGGDMPKVPAGTAAAPSWSATPSTPRPTARGITTVMRPEQTLGPVQRHRVDWEAKAL